MANKARRVDDHGALRVERLRHSCVELLRMAVSVDERPDLRAWCVRSEWSEAEVRTPCAQIAGDVSWRGVQLSGGQIRT